MKFIVYVFVLAYGVQIYDRIVRLDLTTTANQPEFSGQIFGTTLTLHSWIKFNSLGTGCPFIWQAELEGR